MSAAQERHGWVKPAASGLLAWLALSGCGGAPSTRSYPSHTLESQAVCNELRVMLVSEQLGQWIVGISVAYTTTGDATVTAVDYTFGEGDTAEIASDKLAGVEHAYPQPGTYDISARLKVEQDGRAFLTPPDANCTQQFTIEPPPSSPSPA